MERGKSEHRNGMRLCGQGQPQASQRRLDDRLSPLYRPDLLVPIPPAKGSQS
jgi:hypothetical protein